MVFGASGLGARVGNYWLQYAKLCRSAGHYETANRAILEAKASGAPNVHMEKAKLLWSTRRSDGAIAELQQNLLNMAVEVIGFAAVSSITSLSVVPLNPSLLLCDTPAFNDNLDIAKTFLLYLIWIHYTAKRQRKMSSICILGLCFHAGQSKARTINISTEFSALKRMMPLEIIMPIQQSLTVNLPTYDMDLSDSLRSNIFLATDLPTISGIADEAEILSSLQRPKKVVLLGSDGIERPFLCKPKDDLRKD
ncbi:hypothetical protein RHSIM_Rhsim11G0078400 [Rhododendron simsii]|uniref:PI3K/PI4K catalytic domain-containing protein n=1 Tax=Rhododendron simsii TaxID=118357 RepID=A0A834G8E0_RHOSS|nr:hypothetical protein RHSIM_Rhsim11G0078400 [Rhododendron simsii]